jgi:monofunctional biosynthetic peptidoglycan transglycosylase
MQKAWRGIKKVILYLFFFQLFYILFCKWINPPITITQAVSLVQGYGLKRDYVSYDQMSSNIKLAVMASEDQLFPEHNGFDLKAIEKAVQYNKKHPNRRRGASTISQQVAKNVFLWQGGSYDKYIRKIPEIYFTFLIELIWGKKRILEVYLNVIETGPGCFGMEAAARHYFNKSAKSLTPAQAAMIVAGFPNPKKFTASPMSKRVSWRYPQILRQMSNIDTDEDIYALLHKK